MLKNRKVISYICIGTILFMSLLYMSTGKSDVIFKPVPNKSDEAAYHAEVLWPKAGEQSIVGQGSGVAVNSKSEIY